MSAWHPPEPRPAPQTQIRRDYKAAIFTPRQAGVKRTHHPHNPPEHAGQRCTIRTEHTPMQKTTTSARKSPQSIHTPARTEPTSTSQPAKKNIVTNWVSLAAFTQKIQNTTPNAYFKRKTHLTQHTQTQTTTMHTPRAHGRNHLAVGGDAMDLDDFCAWPHPHPFPPTRGSHGQTHHFLVGTCFFIPAQHTHANTLPDCVHPTRSLSPQPLLIMRM